MTNLTPQTTALQTIETALNNATIAALQTIGPIQADAITKHFDDVRTAARELDQQNEQLARDLLDAQADAGWNDGGH